MSEAQSHRAQVVWSDVVFGISRALPNYYQSAAEVSPHILKLLNQMDHLKTAAQQQQQPQPDSEKG
jgi:hypothetical protein